MPTSNMNDWELLQDFVSQRSDAAFQTLVDRYVDLVYTAALRQVRDRHLAQDVCQAVFLILTKNAGKLPPKVVLAGWLFRTTRFVAARAVRTEQRRRLREECAAAMKEQFNSASNDPWAEIEPFLDEAIARLSESDRNAVLQRFFARKTFKDLATTMGTTEEGARKRVGRAVEKLHDFFTRKGVGISTGILGTFLTERCVSAAPIGLAKTIGEVLGNLGSTVPPTILTLEQFK